MPALLFWVLPVILSIGLVALFKMRIDWRSLLKRGLPGVLLALGLTMGCFQVLPPEMRVQFDEMNLVSTSFSMRSTQRDVVATGALPTPHGIVVVDEKLDKRPPLYPFLVSILHWIRGPRISNAYVVNGIVLFSLLVLIYLWLEPMAGKIGGLAAMNLALSPAVAFTATSAQFDLLSCFLLLAWSVALLAFIRKPNRTPWELLGLAMLGLLACYTRYENSLFVLVSFAFTLKKLPRVRLAIVGLTAILLAPLAVLIYRSLDTSFFPENPGMPLLSLSYFLNHLGILISNFLNPFKLFPYSGPVNFVGVVVLVAAILRSKTRSSYLPVGVALLAQVIVLLSWFFSDPINFSAFRLFLLLAVLMAVAPVLAVKLAQEGRKKVVASFLLGASIGVLLWNTQIVREPGLYGKSAGVKVTERLNAFLPSLMPAKNDVLFISEFPTYFIVQGFAALSPSAYLARSEEMNAHPPKNVFLVEAPTLKLHGAAGSVADVKTRSRTELVAENKGSTPLLIWRVL